jgi:hypothetical protein
VNIAISFVGGPADGETKTIPNLEPPPLYLIPIVPSLTEMLASLDVAPAPTPTAEYVPIYEGGHHKRTFNGVFLYRYRVVPPTSEGRQALEEKRRAARAAEARRTAELEATWREIREQRPHFPEDWRDLF